MNSKEIANKYDKQHKDVLKAIRKMIRKNPELETHFTLSSYHDTKNEERPMYIFDDYSEQIMESKYQFNIRSARFEYKMLNEICDFLDTFHIKYEKQYTVLKYRIDLYIPIFNIAVEYDEKEHKYRKEIDDKRQKEIERLAGCRFVRIKEGETVGTAIAKITKQIMSEVNICERKAI